MDKPSVWVRINKMDEMNVYLYGGTSRENSTKSVIYYNDMAEKGGMYFTEILNGGMMMVVFPNSNTNTEFSFDYWIASGAKYISATILCLYSIL